MKKVPISVKRDTLFGRKGTIPYFFGLAYIICWFLIGWYFAGFVLTLIFYQACCAYLLWSLHETWEADFHGRVDRLDVLSPSHNLKPKVEKNDIYAFKLVGKARETRNNSAIEHSTSTTALNKLVEDDKEYLDDVHGFDKDYSEMQNRSVPVRSKASRSSIDGGYLNIAGSTPKAMDKKKAVNRDGRAHASSFLTDEDTELLDDKCESSPERKISGLETIMSESNKDGVKDLPNPQTIINRSNRLGSFKSFRRSRTNSAISSHYDADEVASLSERLTQRRSSLVGFGMKDSNDHKLNMDHIKLTYPQFVYGFFFIRLNLIACFISGFGTYMIERFLEFVLLKYFKITYFEEIPMAKYESYVAEMILETTLAVHFLSFKNTEKGEDKIGMFAFQDFPFTQSDGSMSIEPLLTITINLTTRKFVKGVLGERLLNAQDAMILVAYYGTAAHHPKVHAYANWGCNVNDNLVTLDPYIRNMSNITVMYNYFGAKGFQRALDTAAKNPFFPMPEINFVGVLEQGLDSGIHHHANISELVPHSKFINFLFKLRPSFLAEFVKVKHQFPDVDGEALFIGTVMHSLDHTLFLKNITHPMMMKAKSPEFHTMAMILQIVRSSFSDDLPCLIPKVRFYDAPHPFYQNVYAKAHKIDEFFANNMDACICK